MKFGRSAVISAALAGMLSAPLAIGPQAAHADELADLRANQELLQQRLDQLAQVPISPVGGLYPGGPPAATAGAGIVGGSFPRSFLIPGTDTSIRVGGAISVYAMYFFNGGNPNTTTNTTTNFSNNGALNTAPLHIHTVGPPTFAKAGNPLRSRGDSITFISPQRSKVNFETRTPTAWGEAKTFMEFDWASGNQFSPGNNAGLSTDNLVPRLRLAYASLGGLLGGQAYSNFGDQNARTDAVNVGRDVGDPGAIRIPQLRYTMPLRPWGLPGDWSVSAEAPDTDGWTAAAGVAGSDAVAVAPAVFFNPFKAPVPDWTMAWYIPQAWGHMDFSAVVRPMLQVKDGAFVDRTFAGYGAHFSGDVKPRWFGWDKDDITWQFTGGDGIGRYLGNSSGFALITSYPAAVPASLAAANNVRIRTTVAWGGQTSYQHWWTPTLRSNVSFGILRHDIGNLGGSAFVCASQAAAAAGAGGCGLNKELISSALNLVWNPVPFADIGIEYFHGHRLVLSNLKGDVSGMISRFRVNF